MELSKIADKADDISSITGSASSLMGMASSIGQLNAQSKFKRYMHERAIRALADKKKMSVLNGADNEFKFRRGGYDAEAKSIGNIRGRDTSLKRIASSMNALGSQI